MCPATVGGLKLSAGAPRKAINEMEGKGSGEISLRFESTGA